jgi:hypothetical protein
MIVGDRVIGVLASAFEPDFYTDGWRSWRRYRAHAAIVIETHGCSNGRAARDRRKLMAAAESLSSTLDCARSST